MPECTHDCSTCGESCGERTEPFDFRAPANPHANVKKVIAVMSGKGGVGKSLVTASLAAAVQRRGKQAAILDADITGPSIPKAFGAHTRAMGNEDGILPIHTPSGLKLMSLNFLVEDETDPVVWRGSLIAGTVKQFWSEVQWGDVDYLFVDMPPGTGDEAISIIQLIPKADGGVIVTTPQDVSLLDSRKSITFFAEANIPIIGLVENMSGFVCPHCGEVTDIFKSGGGAATAAEFDIQFLGKVPIEPAIVASGDSGMPVVISNPDSASAKAFEEITEKIVKTVG